MPRTKGSKNRATVIAEELIAKGMDPKEAKAKAKMQYAREAKSLKAASTKGKKKATTRKSRAPKMEYPRTVESYNATTKSAWAKAQSTNSRKNAIRAMCLMCLGGSVKEVKECTSKDCPLWKFRITG